MTVLGNRCEIYDALEAKTPWKYPYQLPIAAIDPEIAASVKEEIRTGSSRYLVVEKEHLPAYMELDVYGEVNRFYKPIAETGKLMLYERR